MYTCIYRPTIAINRCPLFPIWINASLVASRVPRELSANGGEAWIKLRGIITMHILMNPNIPVQCTRFNYFGFLNKCFKNIMQYLPNQLLAMLGYFVLLQISLLSPFELQL